MGITRLVAGTKQVVIPDFGMTFRAPAAAAIPWWLSGGIASASCVAAYRAKGAVSLAASYTNLANPGTYDAAPGVAPAWDTLTGWTFAGLTQYLTTGVSVDGGTYSIVVQFVSATTTNGRIAGTANAGNTNPRAFIIPTNGAGSVLYSNGNGVSAKAPALASGNLIVAGNAAYRDGVSESLTLTAWSGSNTNDLYIGAQNSGGTAQLFCNCVIIALAVYNTTINSSQAAALAAVMATL